MIYAFFASENFLRENIYEKVKGKKQVLSNNTNLNVYFRPLEVAGR